MVSTRAESGALWICGCWRRIHWPLDLPLPSPAIWSKNKPFSATHSPSASVQLENYIEASHTSVFKTSPITRQGLRWGGGSRLDSDPWRPQGPGEKDGRVEYRLRLEYQQNRRRNLYFWMLSWGPAQQTPVLWKACFVLSCCLAIACPTPTKYLLLCPSRYQYLTL